jgi:two-component system, NarL family, response regulator DevR
MNILLADDHPFIREGIKSVLEKAPDIAIVGEACCGEEVLDLCQKDNVNVLILDLRMPGMSTREIIHRIHDLYPGIAILILSAFEDEIFIKAVSSMDIYGYVLKDEAIEKLVEAVRAVYKGETWYSQRIITKMLSIHREQQGLVLTGREKTILTALKIGKTYGEIGQQLSISSRTVRFHTANIQKKLGVKTRNEAVVKALQKGLID